MQEFHYVNYLDILVKIIVVFIYLYVVSSFIDGEGGLGVENRGCKAAGEAQFGNGEISCGTSF